MHYSAKVKGMVLDFFFNHLCNHFNHFCVRLCLHLHSMLRFMKFINSNYLTFITLGISNSKYFSNLLIEGRTCNSAHLLSKDQYVSFNQREI